MVDDQLMSLINRLMCTRLFVGRGDRVVTMSSSRVATEYYDFPYPALSWRLQDILIDELARVPNPVLTL